MATTTLTDRAMVNAPAWEETPCPRCGGLMVQDRFIDLLDDTGHLEFMAARCVSCGEVVDPVIIENRHRRHEPKRSGPKRDRTHVAASFEDAATVGPAVAEDLSLAEAPLS